MKGSNIIFFIFCCLFPASSTTCTDPTGCEFICVGDDPCKDATMTCADGADCVVVCTGYQACAGATINCGANANCNVYCNQTDTNNWSCYNTRIFAESSNQLTVLAIGNNVAKEADISCPNNAPCDLTFIGDNSGYESTINCGNGGQCTITAEGKESLYAGVGTAINAENSETVVITASGQRALGLILKCPRFQSSSEPQCVIKMISDTGTNYDGNEILRWNYISIDSASDIEFECDGTQYDAFFHSTNNEIRSYTDSNEDCVLTLTNTNNNDLQCLTTPGNNDMFEGKRCEAFSTEAPVSNTGISTTNPSQSLTTEPSTVAPTADPSQSPLTTAPTADPSQSPLTTVVATPEQTETFQTSKQAISTVIATLESTVYSIKETTTEHVTDNTDDDSNTEDESVQNAEDKIARHDNTLIMSLVVGSIGMCFCVVVVILCIRKRRRKAERQDIIMISMAHNSDNDNVKVDREVGADDNKALSDVVDEGENEGELVRVWLCSMVGLGQYFDSFIKNGYDSLEFISKITDPKQLVEIGVVMPGHKTQIMAEIEALKHEQKERSENEDSDHKNDDLWENEGRDEPQNTSTNASKGALTTSTDGCHDA